MDTLRAKNAVLTGASRGLGPYIAKALAQEGVNLLLLARSLDKLKQVASELAGYGVNIDVAAADITSPDERRNIPKRARSVLGRVDILINNAAFKDMGSFAKQDTASISRTLDTNILAPMLITRELLPDMLERDEGYIVNVASLGGKVGYPFAAAYAASKGALIEWSLSLNEELRDSNVGTSVICPGFISEDGMFARRKRGAPTMLKACHPEDVARAVIKAIKKRLPEVLVTGRPARPLIVLRAISPRVAYWLGRTLGLMDYTRALAHSDADE